MENSPECMERFSRGCPLIVEEVFGSSTMFEKCDVSKLTVSPYEIDPVKTKISISTSPPINGFYDPRIYELVIEDSNPPSMQNISTAVEVMTENNLIVLTVRFIRI